MQNPIYFVAIVKMFGSEQSGKIGQLRTARRDRWKGFLDLFLVFCSLALSAGLVLSQEHPMQPTQPLEPGEALMEIEEGNFLLQAEEMGELRQRRFDEVSPFFLEAKPAEAVRASILRRELEEKVREEGNGKPLPRLGERMKRFAREVAREFGAKEPEDKGDEFDLTVTPGTNFRLAERREIYANFTIRNRTSRLIMLEFPTTQRFELVLRDGAGVEIERWSTDRKFEDIPAVVTINPDEKIVFSGGLSTRDLVAGKAYWVEASVPGYPQFQRRIQIFPQ